MYLYSVKIAIMLGHLVVYIQCNKNLRKIRVITFTENYGESCMRASERCFQLVLLA